MKQRIASIILCISCLTALTACGDKPASSAPEVSQEPETFGVTELPADTQAETPVVTEQPNAETAQAGQEAPETDNGNGALDQQLAAAILCQQDGLSYDPEDPVYFWRAVGYLAGMTTQDGPGQATEDQGVYEISTEDIQVYIQAMFGGFSGEIPSVTEEDPLVSMADNGDYLIHMPQTTVTLTNLTVTDGSVQAEAAQNGQSAGTYEMTLTDYTGPQSGQGLFRYSLTGVTKQN